MFENKMSMVLHPLLAWMHWDPSRFAFTIPYIQRPVAWYGICFAMGFILGFFIIIPIFKRKLSQTQNILERDIASWPTLLASIKNALNNSDHPFLPIFQKLEKKTRETIKQLKFKQEVNDIHKKEILDVLNSNRNNLKLRFSRQKLEECFPKAIYKIRDLCLFLTDRLTWFVVAGTLIGARLGHVFFYEWPRYREHPLDILKIWEGGLASHGGTIGIMLALFIYQRTIHKKFPELTFITLLDILCIPTAMAAVWIRIGNFFNQEITGPVTTVPWAIVFGHPYDGGSVLPRHPAQLYEALACLLTFVILYLLWKKKSHKLKPGTLIGLFMILVFGSRFLIEFVKTPLSFMIDESFLQTGQLLSIPFIIFGCALFLYNNLSRRTKRLT